MKQKGGGRGTGHTWRPRAGAAGWSGSRPTRRPRPRRASWPRGAKYFFFNGTGLTLSNRPRPVIYSAHTHSPPRCGLAVAALAVPPAMIGFAVAALAVDCPPQWVPCRSRDSLLMFSIKYKLPKPILFGGRASRQCECELPQSATKPPWERSIFSSDYGF